MKKIVILIIITFVNSASAQIPAHLNALETIKDNISFVGDGHQGFMEMAFENGDVFTVWHFYDFVKYEDLENWEKGEKFRVAFNKGLGYGIVREKTDMFYKAVFVNEYEPINDEMDKCLKTAMPTRDIVQCYADANKQWQTEYRFIFRKLQGRLSETVAKQLVTLDRHLENLAGNYFKAYHDHLWPPGDTLGTIKFINMASTGKDYEEMRYKALLNFYF